jgi:hypothetical protein
VSLPDAAAARKKLGTETISKEAGRIDLVESIESIDRCEMPVCSVWNKHDATAALGFLGSRV